MSGIINSAGSRSGVLGTTEIDYEEGAWTAAITDGSDNAMNLTTNECSYIKIGRLVFISGALTTDSVGSASGGIKVTGLPFSSWFDDSGKSAITIAYAGGWNITATESVVLHIPSGGSTVMNFFIWNSAGGVDTFTAAEWSDDGSMQFGGTYQSN